MFGSRQRTDITTLRSERNPRFGSTSLGFGFGASRGNENLLVGGSEFLTTDMEIFGLSQWLRESLLPYSWEILRSSKVSRIAYQFGWIGERRWQLERMKNMHFENETFRKRWRFDDHLVSLAVLRFQIYPLRAGGKHSVCCCCCCCLYFQNFFVLKFIWISVDSFLFWHAPRAFQNIAHFIDSAIMDTKVYGHSKILST